VENGIGAKKYPKDKLQFIEQIISAFLFLTLENLHGYYNQIGEVINILNINDNKLAFF
jgi:hypothetical protein